MLSDDQPRSNALAASAHFILRQRNVYRSRVQRIQKLIETRTAAIEKMPAEEVPALLLQLVREVSDIAYESEPIQTDATEDPDVG